MLLHQYCLLDQTLVFFSSIADLIILCVVFFCNLIYSVPDFIFEIYEYWVSLDFVLDTIHATTVVLQMDFVQQC